MTSRSRLPRLIGARVTRPCTKIPAVDAIDPLDRHLGHQLGLLDGGADRLPRRACSWTTWPPRTPSDGAMPTPRMTRRRSCVELADERQHALVAHVEGGEAGRRARRHQAFSPARSAAAAPAAARPGRSTRASTRCGAARRARGARPRPRARRASRARSRSGRRQRRSNGVSANVQGHVAAEPRRSTRRDAAAPGPLELGSAASRCRRAPRGTGAKPSSSRSGRGTDPAAPMRRPVASTS